MKKIYALSLILVCAASDAVFGQGSLTPPGPPAPMMKSLDQIDSHIATAGEKRTPITALPFTVNTPGSYYLTGNLAATADGAAITIAADNVTIDLNGFTLSGGSGVRTGIDVPAARKNLCVRNGILTGWGFGAVSAGLNMNGAIFEDLRVTGNVTAVAIAVGDGALVRRCVINGNGNGNSLPALLLGTGSTMTDSTVFGNLGIGIQTYSRCNVLNTSASANIFDGISAGSDSTVAHCTASGNGRDGILANTGASVIDCTMSGNDTGIVAAGGNTISRCLVYSSIKSGISIGYACQVTGCTVAGNNGNSTANQAGLKVTGSGSRIDSNHFANNNFAGLIATGTGVSGNIIIRNTFFGAQSIIDPSNITGPGIVMSSGGTITNTNPWANIYY